MSSVIKFNDDLVYHILLKILMDMDAYVYVKQKYSMQNGQTVFFDIHNQLLRPDHVIRQSTKVEGKLQNSHYEDKKKGWGLDKYFTLHKEQHTIMYSLGDYGYSAMNNGTNVCHFLQGSKSTELEVVVNII